MNKYMLARYILLISDFVVGVISVEKFRDYYFRISSDEKYIFGDEIYPVIGGLFLDIDAYCGDPTIADYDSTNPFCDIDEAELRKRATVALEKLKILQATL